MSARRVRGILRSRAGMTLTEVLVSTTLLMMLLASVLGLLQPYTAAFWRIRRMQSCQQVADALMEKAASQLRSAREISYPSDEGETIAFLNPDNFVIVLSTAGATGTSPATATMGEARYSFPAGRACQLYCTLVKGEGEDGEYAYAIDTAAAQGFDGWMGAGFYGSFTARFQFTLTPAHIKAHYIEIAVQLTEPESGFTHEETGVIDLANNPTIMTYQDTAA